MKNSIRKSVEIKEVTRFTAALILGNIAYSIAKQKGLDVTRSEVMKKAYKGIEKWKSEKLTVVRWVKKDGSECVRVVASWSKFHTVKGTGRPTPKGYKLYTDVAKNILGICDTTMVKVENIFEMDVWAIHYLKHPNKNGMYVWEAQIPMKGAAWA